MFRLLRVVLPLGIGFCFLTSAQVSELKTVSVKAHSLSETKTSPSDGKPKAPDALDEVLSATFFHGIPLDLSARALRSPNAVERLLRILQDWRKQAEWENATLLLGLSGDGRAYSALVEFLRRDDSAWAFSARCRSTPHCASRLGGRDLSRLVSRDIYFAKSNVPIALGLWIYEVNRSGTALDTEKADVIQYLESCSQPRAKFWNNQIHWRAETYPDDRVPYMYADLSTQCIQGLGLSGDRAAVHIYLQEWLPRHIRKMDEATDHGRLREKVVENGYPPEIVNEAFFESFYRTAKSALETNEAVASLGLKEYYASQRKRHE